MSSSQTNSTNGTAQIGVTGLAVMGSNIARNFAHHGYTVALHNRSIAKTDALLERARLGRQVRPPRDHRGVPGRAGEAAPGADHGQGRRPHRRRHQRARRRDGAGRHHHRRRQRALHRHDPPREGHAGTRPALRRRRHLRRRGGCAQRAVDHARAARPSPTRRWARCSRRSPPTSTACPAAPTSARTAPATS